ncbi:MAG: 50S ribosomal protein L21 [Candidatus Shapirobacteria bacterium]|jgi:large subunit ribosomal protein L21
MKYAVISLSGSQYKVTEGQTATLDKIEGKEGDKVTTDQVLLISQDGKVELGKPTIKDASVDFEIVKHYQDKKIKVFKYKSKSRYHKTQGFRAQLTDIKILDIKIKSKTL